MFTLKPVQAVDQQLITQWFANDVKGQKELSSYMDVSSWLKLLNPNSRFGWIVEEDEKSLGFVDLERGPAGQGYFSFYVNPQDRGKGKSKLLLKALIDKARELDFQKLEAGAEETNIASRRALSSMGFSQDGKDKDGYLIYNFTL